METTKLDYKLKKYNEENVEILLKELGLNSNNYFLAVTKASMLNRAIIGNVVDFFNRNCIICFSETEIDLIMLSRIDNKKITEIVKINRNEINNVKLSNILISYMLNVKLDKTSMKFQVFKKVRGFTKLRNAIDLFDKMY